MGIVVLGAVFVDIKGYPADVYIPGGRNAGRVEIVHGGVSRNLVEDIANVELRPTFVSLVDTTGTGADVIRKLQDHKVNTDYIRAVPDGMGTWLAVFDNGCVNFCTYCIIPYARGPVRSLSLEQAVEQTRQLAADGYREIVLTGIEISSWGHDFKNGQSLIDLLEALSAAAPEVRLRLGSLEPRTVTEDFCRRAAALPNLCPQFHLSMQSGCDATLKRMNRKYDTARYLESVELLNRWFDRPAVTTDLITGFPEETEEEFAQTLDFIRKCRFAQMHIFPYSIRPGTPAAKMEQVSKAVKEERARRAAAVAEEMHRSYLEGCVGRTYPVLFEQPKNGKFFGHAPNYMEVLVDGAELHNALRTVRITDVDGEALLGEIVEQEAEA